MQWTELYELAGAGSQRWLLLDLCARALSDSTDVVLHAEMTAEVPTLAKLCAALDAHNVPVPPAVETQVVASYRLAMT